MAHQYDLLSQQILYISCTPCTVALKRDTCGKAAACSGFSADSHPSDLESLYVFCLEALGAFRYRELYGLAFLQTAKSV